MKKFFLFKILFGMLLLTISQVFLNCGQKETGCGCEGVKTATSTLLVYESKPEAEFSTYDYSGNLEADGACHARMKLRFYFTDPDLAITGERPPLLYEFKSLFGYFPTNEGMEQRNFEPNTNTFYWTIEISEAIDKSKPEGSSYGVYVKYNGIGGGSNEAIECLVSIVYQVYDEDAYVIGCEH